MRLLIVEDDPILSDGLRVGLGLAGCTIDAVTSCGDARAALETSKFDAVVLDLMLPDGAGLDLLKEIRAAGDLTPIVLLTALDRVADRIKGLIPERTTILVSRLISTARGACSRRGEAWRRPSGPVSEIRRARARSRASRGNSRR